MEIKSMKREGHSIREISRRTGRSRNTVRKVLRNKAPDQTKRRRKGSILDEYKVYLKRRYHETGLSGVRLLEEIAGLGYEGSVDTVRRYLAAIDREESVSAKATVRFETPPGKQAQVDWAEIGKMPDEAGKMKKVYAFVMVLGFSRMTFVEFTYSMKLPVLIACQQKAFEYFGGYTREILYDNMAQVRHPSGKLNPKMLDFLSFYGITLKTHRPRRPRTKGKVERNVHYLKDNFIKGREFRDFADLQARGRSWLDNTANRRVHATTGKIPFEMLKEEGLLPLEAVGEYKRVESVQRKVTSEGYILIGGSRYSVPPKMVGRKVTVESGYGTVSILAGETIVAKHPQARKRKETVTDPVHAAEMWKLSVRGQTVPKAKPAKLLIQIPDERPLTVYEEVIG
ncbi:MAG: IS21 family transposase [Pyrinomonadaceae bacterium]|nr:IS21 family transposase [Pyrinomonadaceae bacterium]